ncbi:hypothetical protein RFEPED_0783 [Rickettsia felis str. Pedreira]|nr:hypothetical protein [Rickettsia felis]KHO03225.1 hypothetical protein JS55_02245 [Rickettsia felis str. LSU]KJV58402.1 hypothetical protein RFEPED_0783 [Rickettsia felis str. Pedreira]MDE8611461.1 hypothetical protein [Rickettsia felis]
MLTNQQENLDPVLLQNTAKELGSNFQKALDEDNVEDFKKLMFEMIDFINMSSIQPNFNIILDEKSLIKIAKLAPITSLAFLTKICLPSEQSHSSIIYKALTDCIQSQEITGTQTFVSLLFRLTGNDIKDDNKYLYEGLKTGNIEIVKNLLSYINLDQEAFNIAMEKGRAIKDFICQRDEKLYHGGFFKQYLASETQVDITGDSESHPE